MSSDEEEFFQDTLSALDNELDDGTRECEEIPGMANEGERKTGLNTDEFQIVIDGERFGALEWLRGLIPHNEGLKRAHTPVECPYLRPEITPMKHQMEALGSIEYNMNSVFKAFYLADPPGLGKTLPAQMAIARSLATAERSAVVVVHESIVSQWVGEFEKYFIDGAIDVYALKDETVPPKDLLKYDVVITSYQFLLALYREWVPNRSVKSHDNEEVSTRSNLSILADVLFDSKVKSTFLVLDDAHLINDTSSPRYAAVRRLRDSAHGCIMLSSNLIEDTWQDIYAPATLLRAQPFHSMYVLQQVFTEPHPKKKGVRSLPTGRFSERLHTFLMAWVLRRPADTISLPPLTEVTVEFDLSLEERTASDYHFQQYKEGMSNQPKQ